MKVLMVGSGGREHALVKKLLESERVESVICAPGNGGISCDAKCVNVSVMDISGMISLAKEEKVDFVFVAPDDPLAAGMVDEFEKEGFRCFGPSALAARIESSKVFSKNLMKKYSIPTAAYEVFSDAAKAIDYISNNLNARITLTDIADALNMTSSYLSKLFSKETGQSISAYIKEEKLKAAANMLQYSDISITDISEYYHFSSQSHFTASFTELFGLTPKKYRDKYNKKIFM